MPPSFELVPRVIPNVFTTTVFADGAPTATESTSSSHKASLPIGAIVGGLVAGVCLALVAVGGWIWWGKSLKKKRQTMQPRFRSAMKQKGQGSPNTNMSKHSLPRSNPAKNPMASVSQKSVTFAPVPSTRSSEDSESPQTPSPISDSETSIAKDEGKLPPRAAEGPSTPPPRSALRPPPAKRVQSAERAYAPTRPSPLAHASHPPASMRPQNMHTRTGEAKSPPARHPPPPSRQVSNLSADRSSAVSAPSEYSQEGTASEGEPPFRMMRASDGRLYAHQESEENDMSGSRPRQHAPPTITRIP